MPTEPTQPHGGGPPDPDATLHKRVGEELDALRARLVDADARHRASIEAARLRSRSTGQPDAEPEPPGLPE